MLFRSSDTDLYVVGEYTHLWTLRQLLRPDCISHPCPMIRARMRSRLCHGWKNIASTCDLLLIRRVHSVAALITSAFERIAHTFDSYWPGVWVYRGRGLHCITRLSPWSMEERKWRLQRSVKKGIHVRLTLVTRSAVCSFPIALFLVHLMHPRPLEMLRVLNSPILERVIVLLLDPMLVLQIGRAHV